MVSFEPTSQRSQRIMVLAICFSLLFAFFPSSFQLKAQDNRFFPETGHSVSGKFLEYWTKNGGLSVYGYPITDAQNEVDPETGKTFLIQWFERNRFELHPENAGTRYEVLLGLLGKDLRREALVVNREFAPAASYLGSEQPRRFFSETNHNVSGKILTYWEKNGGLERFGYPISEAHSEIDPETGRSFLSQWFERARFELHPENQPPYEVLLGLLGNQIKKPSAVPLQFSWKMEQSDTLLINQRGIAVDSQGNFYLAADDEYVYKHGNPEGERPARIFKFDKGGRLLSKWGSYGQGDSQFQIFGGVAVDSQDNVYAADWNSGFIQKFDSTGRFLQKWGGLGQEEGKFQHPTGLALDAQNNLYVVDAGLNRVQKFDATGKFLLGWSNIGRPSGQGSVQFNNPNAITVDASGNVYVADSRNFRVEKFDSSGQFLLQWGGQGTGDGQFGYVPYMGHTPSYGGPVSLVADKSGLIYVTDWGNHRIEKFDTQGKFLESWTNLSAFDPNLYPRLAVDTSGNLYLAAEARVDKYSSAKQLLGQWVIQYEGLNISSFSNIQTDGQGNLYFPESNALGEHLKKINSAGQTLLQFDVTNGTPQNSFGWPCGVRDIAVSPSGGEIYLLCSDSVKVFDKVGHFLREWGSRGDKDGQFNILSALVLDKASNVYVLDSYNRIQKFDANGHFLKKWNTRNADNTGNLLALDLAIDSQNRLYVSVDPTEKTILVYNTEGQLTGTITGVGAKKLSIDGQGNIFALMEGGDLAKIKDGVVVWYFSTKAGQGDGSLIGAKSIAVDNQGNLYALGGFEIAWLQKLRLT
ncbi:MAG: hypothetical protein WCS37_18765 [Chloroflexota bacterium]